MSECIFLFATAHRNSNLNAAFRSSALAAGLGWSLPLSGSVLATQLLQLGQMHGSVHDEGLARTLASVVPQLYK